MLLAVIVFSLSGIVLIAFGTRELVEKARWSRRASRATGVVWEVKVETQGEHGPYRWPRIAFRAADKRRYEFESSWWSRGRGQGKEGDEVEVLYDPDDPETAEIAAFLDLLGPSLLCLVGGAAALGAAVFLAVAR